jgi:hypothetical protein
VSVTPFMMKFLMWMAHLVPQWALPQWASVYLTPEEVLGEAPDGNPEVGL